MRSYIVYKDLRDSQSAKNTAGHV